MRLVVPRGLQRRLSVVEVKQQSLRSFASFAEELAHSLDIGMSGRLPKVLFLFFFFSSQVVRGVDLTTPILARLGFFFFSLSQETFCHGPKLLWKWARNVKRIAKLGKNALH